MVYAAAYPLARGGGMAVLFTDGLSRREITIATLTAFLCAVPFGWLGAVAWVGALVVATLIARFAITRLGGMTGDIYGTVCECVEVTVLVITGAHPFN
jgi:adenosylcobinamide-GDP ribazoletransferase